MDKAKNKYIKINSLAMSLVKPGGLLLTCTCSAAVTQTEGAFTQFVKEASSNVKRDVTVLSISNAASDHPIHLGYPESNYLTAVLCRIL